MASRPIRAAKIYAQLIEPDLYSETEVEVPGTAHILYQKIDRGEIFVGTKHLDDLILVAIFQGNCADLSSRIQADPTILNVTTQFSKNSMLHLACLHGRKDIVQLLIDRFHEYSIDLSVHFRCYQTPFHALINGALETNSTVDFIPILEYFAQNGIVPEIKLFFGASVKSREGRVCDVLDHCLRRLRNRRELDFTRKELLVFICSKLIDKSDWIECFAHKDRKYYKFINKWSHELICDMEERLGIDDDLLRIFPLAKKRLRPCCSHKEEQKRFGGQSTPVHKKAKLHCSRDSPDKVMDGEDKANENDVDNRNYGGREICYSLSTSSSSSSSSTLSTSLFRHSSLDGDADVAHTAVATAGVIGSGIFLMEKRSHHSRIDNECSPSYCARVSHRQVGAAFKLNESSEEPSASSKISDKGVGSVNDDTIEGSTASSSHQLHGYPYPVMELVDSGSEELEVGDTVTVLDADMGSLTSGTQPICSAFISAPMKIHSAFDVTNSTRSLARTSDCENARAASSSPQVILAPSSSSSSSRSVASIHSASNMSTVLPNCQPTPAQQRQFCSQQLPSVYRGCAENDEEDDMPDAIRDLSSFLKSAKLGPIVVMQTYAKAMIHRKIATKELLQKWFWKKADALRDVLMSEDVGLDEFQVDLLFEKLEAKEI